MKRQNILVESWRQDKIAFVTKKQWIWRCSDSNSKTVSRKSNFWSLVEQIPRYWTNKDKIGNRSFTFYWRGKGLFVLHGIKHYPKIRRKGNPLKLSLEKKLWRELACFYRDLFSKSDSSKLIFYPSIIGLQLTARSGLESSEVYFYTWLSCDVIHLSNYSD